MGSNYIHSGATLKLPVPVAAQNLFSQKYNWAVLAILFDNSFTSFGIRDLSRATAKVNAATSCSLTSSRGR